MIITTKNFQYRCNGLSTSEESITLVSPVEKKKYAYSIKKKSKHWLSKKHKNKRTWGLVLSIHLMILYA